MMLKASTLARPHSLPPEREPRREREQPGGDGEFISGLGHQHGHEALLAAQAKDAPAARPEQERGPETGAMG